MHFIFLFCSKYARDSNDAIALLVINYMLDRFVPKGFFDRSGLLFYAMQAFFTMVFGEKRGFGGPFFSWRVYLSDRWDFVCQHLSFDSVEGDDAGRDSKRLCISTKLVVCFLFGHVLQCIVVFVEPKWLLPVFVIVVFIFAVQMQHAVEIKGQWWLNPICHFYIKLHTVYSTFVSGGQQESMPGFQLWHSVVYFAAFIAASMGIGYRFIKKLDFGLLLENKTRTYPSIG